MIIMNLLKISLALVIRDISNMIYEIKDRKANKELSQELVKFFSKSMRLSNADIEESEKSKRNFPFHYACIDGDLNKAKDLFSKDPNIINICPDNDVIICRLPMVLALCNRHYDIANFILDGGFVPTVEDLICNDRLYYNFETFKKVLDSVLSIYNLGINLIFETDKYSKKKTGLLYSIFSAMSRAESNNDLKEVLKSFKYLMGLGLNVNEEKVNEESNIKAYFLKTDKTPLAILKMVYICRISVAIELMS